MVPQFWPVHWEEFLVRITKNCSSSQLKECSSFWRQLSVCSWRYYVFVISATISSLLDWEKCLVRITKNWSSSQLKECSSLWHQLSSCNWRHYVFVVSITITCTFFKWKGWLYRKSTFFIFITKKNFDANNSIFLREIS